MRPAARILRQRLAPSMLLIAVLLPAACTSTSLPYAPTQQPSGARISAAYQLIGDRLRIEVDSGGRRVEEATIISASGATVRAQAIDMPTTTSVGSPVGIGIGIGGGSFGTRGGVGVGTGVSVGVPVGGGSSVVEGNPLVWFPLAEAGPAPWRLYLKLAGLDTVLIVVGGPLPNQ
ncbi:MAG TPA: hypothetical protein VHT71_20245 [Methylomirabilota bacterium]|jgi:hypothetical protein|nr:hypothetical protein [Methylomirabilota bacterium]